MLLQKGDMWDCFDEVDLFLITTNATVTRDRKLIMGGGIALEAMERFPGVDSVFGKIIGPNKRYGLLVSKRYPDKKLGAFQVKDLYNKPADIGLVALSTIMLYQWCQSNPMATVALNFPAIGLGGLQRSYVLPFIEILPDQVTVWEYDVN